MTSYGIKVSQPGFDVKTALPHQLSFSSKYGTLKISSQGSGTVTDSGGTITIPHNLGYVPAFLVHVDPGQVGKYYIAPYIPTGIFGTPLVWAYADSTNLYIKAIANTNTDTYFLSSTFDESMAREVQGVGYLTDGWSIGVDGSGFYRKGAVRFTNISATQGETISTARLNLYIANRVGTGQVKATFWGINEDNTVAFNSGTAATARSKTTATLDAQTTQSVGTTWGITVTSIVQEILNRGGWANGNAMGLQFWDNGTGSGNIYQQLSDNSNTNLTITTSVATIADYKYTIFLNQLV